MPADIKTHPASHRPDSLEGAVFTFHSESDRFEAIDKAFDYRGDVTLTLHNGQIEGYIFNREPKAMPPRIANGKSWDAWVSKKESERKAEADRIKAEAQAQGHL